MNDPLISPESWYATERKKQGQALEQLEQKRNLLGWMRLLVVIITAVLAFPLFNWSLAAGLLGIAIGIGIFLFLVSTDINNQQELNHTKRIIWINEEELAVLQHHFHRRPDGSLFLPERHDYAADLDLFGKASLYQYVNRCNSGQGQQQLADNLLHPLAAAEILLRQEAVRELAPQTAWRQHFQALGSETSIQLQTEQVIAEWLQQPSQHFTGSYLNYFVPLYTAGTLSTLALAIIGWLPVSIFSFLFILYFSFSTLLSRSAMKAYTTLNGIIRETDTLYQVMQCIEQKEFSAPLLKQMKQHATTGNDRAWQELKRLKEILNRFDLRLNVLVFIFINSFLLWDVRQMMQLNSWRKKNKSGVQSWFRMISGFEVLNSLATLHFNQPRWVFPQVAREHFTLQGRGIGHPLLHASVGVPSDFQISGRGTVAVVTGSNMAGKSTFLRSLGTNIVLAQMGAPVCAAAFVVSPVKLMSSMRIADNLAENTSTFYAELKKLKNILGAVNRKEPLFILLDEILRGTNSLDRHTGSMAFVRQLIRKEAVAVIATHDLEIGKLAEEYPGAVHNYHFDVQVAGEELYFDYKLKEGICTSLNASLLMKKIGIEL